MAQHILIALTVSLSSVVLSLTKHRKVNLETVELDIRDKIVLDLGMKQRPDYEHVRRTASPWMCNFSYICFQGKCKSRRIQQNDESVSSERRTDKCNERIKV